MSWWTGRAVGFDTETDGPVPTEARIITAATVIVGRGGPREREILIKPERDIPAGAIEVHGITTEHARENGMEREAGLRVVVEMLMEAGPDTPVVGHNVSYDLTLLDRELRRLGIGVLGTNLSTGLTEVWVDNECAVAFPVIDTLVLDKAVDRFRNGKRKLEVTAAHYGVPMADGSAHGATADVVASLRIAIAIANRGHHANLSLHDLHLRQVEWAAGQAESLRNHFIKLNDPEKDPAGVSGEWPFRRLREDETTETVDTTVL